MNSSENPEGIEVHDRPMFPADRTFVVRFDCNSDLADGGCRGRIEDVASTRRGRFRDEGELLEQLRLLLGG